MSSRKSSISEDLVIAGRVRSSWGVKGQLGVDWNNGSCPVDIGSGGVYLQKIGGSQKKFTITHDHRHGNYNVVTLKEIGSREEAAEYRGSKIWVERGRLPRLKSGEYYTYQLIDIKVETIDGEALGQIKEIFSTGSNDVYVVREGDKEILIPAIADVVKKIDIEKGIMIVELMEGLRDV